MRNAIRWLQDARAPKDTSRIRHYPVAGVSLWLFIDAVVNRSGAARKLGVDDSEAGHERAFGKVGLRKPKRRRKTK